MSSVTGLMQGGGGGKVGIKVKDPKKQKINAAAATGGAAQGAPTAVPTQAPGMETGGPVQTQVTQDPSSTAQAMALREGAGQVQPYQAPDTGFDASQYRYTPGEQHQVTPYQEGPAREIQQYQEGPTDTSMFDQYGYEEPGAYQPGQYQEEGYAPDFLESRRYQEGDAYRPDAYEAPGATDVNQFQRQAFETEDINPALREQWEQVQQGFGAGLESQLGDIQRQTAQQSRRQAAMNSLMGGQVGGAFAAGQTQAGMEGAHLRSQAIGQSERDKQQAQQAWLNTIGQQAAQRGDENLRAWAQGEQMRVQTQEAEKERGLRGWGTEQELTARGEEAKRGREASQSMQEQQLATQMGEAQRERGARAFGQREDIMARGEESARGRQAEQALARQRAAAEMAEARRGRQFEGWRTGQDIASREAEAAKQRGYGAWGTEQDIAARQAEQLTGIEAQQALAEMGVAADASAQEKQQALEAWKMQQGIQAEQQGAGAAMKFEELESEKNRDLQQKMQIEQQIQQLMLAMADMGGDVPSSVYDELNQLQDRLAMTDENIQALEAEKEKEGLENYTYTDPRSGNIKSSEGLYSVSKERKIGDKRR